MYDSVVVDALNLSYRNWWHCRMLTTSTGLHSGLEFGFLRALLMYVRNYYPAKVYLAWDGCPKRVLAVYPEYKAGRDKSKQQEEAPWHPRLDTLRQSVATMVHSFYDVELEADEIIAHFVHQQEKEQKKTLIVSNDGDLHQLVSDFTFLDPSDKEGKMFTPALVQEKWGVLPEKVPFLRAIAGDVSDNIPGVPRIPQDIKVKLAQEAKNIDHLIELFHSAGYLSQRQREKLLGSIFLVRRNYTIMYLRDKVGTLKVPVQCTGDTTKVMELAKLLELKSLFGRKEFRLLEEQGRQNTSTPMLGDAHDQATVCSRQSN